MEAPAEVADRVQVPLSLVLADGDAYTGDIYHLDDHVMWVSWTRIARCFVDLNRSPHELPPEAKDGVIKDMTSYGVRVYQAGREPDEELMALLITLYYEPYHREIAEALKMPGLRLALDCHAMAPIGSPVSRDPGQRRPSFCLGNAGGLTCPSPMLEKLASCFVRAFRLPPEEVALNRPFSGGYLTRTYGQGKTPWVQVEINKAMFLPSPSWINAGDLAPDRERLRNLHENFELALRIFFEE
jgi:formiminoglutamase